jgi:DNA repair exonuclease SbcCD ATPase subunit
MAGKDVTLIIGGQQVFPRTYSHNVIDIYNGETKSISTVLSELREAQNHTTEDLRIHAAQIGSLDTRITNAEVAHAQLVERVGSAEQRIATNESSIKDINESVKGINSTLENHDGRIVANANAIEAIRELIPNTAGKENQLADKNFVNDAIQNISAYYITNAEGNAFATYAELEEATLAGELYSGGELRTNPTRNDYAIVLSDETKLPEGDADGNPTTRYIYDEGWKFQYVVNNTALTVDQLAAINSGVTAELVAKITANESAIGTLTQTVTDNKTEIDGRLDAAEGRLDAIDGEEGRLATIESTAAELAQTVADNKTELDERIDNIINSNLGGLDKEIAEINSNITALQQELDGVPADENGNGAVVGIKERLTTAEGDIDALEGRASAVEGRMDTAEADIDAAEGRLDAIEAAINGTPAVEGESEGTVGIIGRLDGHDQDISDLRTLIDEKQADLTAGQYVTITEDAESGSQIIDVKVDLEFVEGSTNPVASNVVKAELDKKVEVSDEVDFELDMDVINTASRIAALEGQVAYLIKEVEYLRSLHNGGDTPVNPDQPSAPTQAPTNVNTSSTDISFDEVPGAEGYNVYVDGEHKQTIQ